MERPADLGGVYRVGEAARIAGVSPTTVRVWERKGLLRSHRGENGYRYFREADVQRLRRIVHLRKTEHLNVEGIRRALAAEPEQPQPRPSDSLGGRLRDLRVRAGLTLEEAGREAQVSPSFLSALERDQSGVSPQVLHRLAHLYGSNFSALLRHDSPSIVQHKRAEGRAKERMHGLEVEQLIDGQTMMDAALVTLAPEPEGTGAYTHDGEEIVFVLAGELEVVLNGGGERHVVAANESLFYPSTIEHEWRNAGSVPVRFLWIATPPSF